jgi:hypothetical protein
MQKEIIAQWEKVGNAIMLAATGREGQLSDSDVIGEISRLRFEITEARDLLERVSSRIFQLDEDEDWYDDVKTWMANNVSNNNSLN